jgi:hypothetical protein
MFLESKSESTTSPCDKPQSRTYEERYLLEIDLYRKALERRIWNIGSGDYTETPSKNNRFSPPTATIIENLLNNQNSMWCIDIGAGNALTFLQLSNAFPHHNFIVHNLSGQPNKRDALRQNLRRISSDYEGLCTVMKRNKLHTIDILHERCGPLSLSLVPELVLAKYCEILQPNGIMILSNPWGSSLLYPENLKLNVNILRERDNALKNELHRLNLEGWQIRTFSDNVDSIINLSVFDFNEPLISKGFYLKKPPSDKQETVNNKQ